jgi:hypothetical protein
MSEQEIPSPIHITVTPEGANVSTVVGPGIMITQFLPNDMIENICRGIREERKKQEVTDIQILRTMRNVKQ